MKSINFKKYIKKYILEQEDKVRVAHNKQEFFTSKGCKIEKGEDGNLYLLKSSCPTVSENKMNKNNIILSEDARTTLNQCPDDSDCQRISNKTAALYENKSGCKVGKGSDGNLYILKSKCLSSQQPVPADSPGTDWKEIARDIYNKLVAAGKEVKDQAGKLWGKITDIATIDTPPAPPAQPAPPKVGAKFPACISGDNQYRGIPKLEELSKDEVTFLYTNKDTNKRVRYHLYLNRNWKDDDQNEGTWYCDGKVLSLEKTKVKDELNSLKEQITIYNTGKLQIFNGEYAEININLLESVTNYLINKMNKHYCGKYFKDFRNLLEVLKNYVVINGRRIDVEYGVKLGKFITAFNAAITTNELNPIVGSAGLDWSLLENPTEDMKLWTERSISEDIGATAPITIYRYRAQSTTSKEVQDVSDNIKSLIGDRQFDCRTVGVQYLEQLAYLNNVYDLIDGKRDKTMSNTVNTADYSPTQMKGMIEIVAKCSTSHQYNKKYDKVLTKLSLSNVFKDVIPNKMPTNAVKENKNNRLTSVIRKTLIETKETKKKLIQESKIINLRFNILLESKPKNRKQLDALFINILTEMIYLHKQGFDDKLIAENASSVFNILGTLFGGSTNGVLEMFRTKGVKYILEQLGIGDNTTFKNYMTSALENTELKDVPKLFTDCDFLTKKISISIPDSYVKQIDDAKEMGNEFLTIVGDTLQSVVRDSDFNERLESRIQRIVCPLVDKMSQKFGDKLNTMKTTLVSQPLNTQL